MLYWKYIEKGNKNMGDLKQKLRNNKKLVILLSVVSILIIVVVIITYNLQFTIFKYLYESDNNSAKKIYSINKNNENFKNNIDRMFTEKSNEYISKYKKNEITYEELKENINKFVDYKDCNSKLEEIKEQKEKYEQAEKYSEQKEYKEALPIYIELNNDNYDDLSEKITETKNELKQFTVEQVEKFKQETNYSEAIKAMEEIKEYYSDDEEVLNLLSEVKQLQQTQENNEKEKQKIEEIKSSIKILKIWTASPNSAGGVDLYINWENISDKVIKYAYFTVVPFNSVNDIVNCTIRHYSSYTAQDDGPYSKGQGTKGTGYYWENAWYNYSIKGAKLENVRIMYMDGSILDIPEKYIDYIK